MGANSFCTRAKGETAEKAFYSAVEDARAEYGCRGYTGSIAEKHEFVIIDLPPGADAEDFAYSLMEDDNHPTSDKWGPAGCIPLGDGSFLLFGYASS